MVFAVAALFVQLSAAPSPVAIAPNVIAAAPTTAIDNAATNAALDETKPATTKAATTTNTPTATSTDGTKPTARKSTPDSNSTDSSHTHLNNASLNDAGASRSATLTAVSLADPQKQGLSTVRIPERDSDRAIPIPAINGTPSRRNWIVLATFEHSAAAFDAYSTRQAIGRGAIEMDPMMKPFAHSSAIYAAIQVGPVVMDLLARRMQRSENPMFRRMWWMPQSISAAAFLTSGIHNTGVRGRP